MSTSSAYLEVPFTDLLTWTFGNTSYDLDKPLFIDTQNPERTISHTQAKTTVRKLIAGLRANGLQRGDSVCLHSSNNINYALLFLAVIGAGGRFIGSNPHYTTAELVHLFTVSEVKFVIVEKECQENVQTAAASLDLSSNHIFIFDTDSTCHININHQSWNVLLQSGEKDWVKFDDEHSAKTTVACLMSTSGTTGLPKAAQSSHYAQLAGSIALCERDKPYEIIRLVWLPQFHAFNAPLSLILPIREGRKTYIMKRYNLVDFLDSLKKFKPTETTMVSPVIFKLMRLEEQDRVLLHSLRAIWCGGVPLDVSIQNRFQQMIHPDAVVSQVYGMTEIGWSMGLKFPEVDDTGCAGRLLPNMEARIVDRYGNDIHRDNCRGEILLRAPSLMIGYLNNMEATKDTIIDGWLHTGDIGYHYAGKWYIVDRIKELIKVRGWQVSPTEIEKCLLTHPAIVEVAVIGVDLKDEHGELPRAYVVVDPALPTTDQEFQRHLIGRLSRYKAIDGGVRRVDALPRSSTGKVLKSFLREQARKEVLEIESMTAPLKQIVVNRTPTDAPDLKVELTGAAVESTETIEE